MKVWVLFRKASDECLPDEIIGIFSTNEKAKKVALTIKRETYIMNYDVDELCK